MTVSESVYGSRIPTPGSRCPFPGQVSDSCIVPRPTISGNRSTGPGIRFQVSDSRSPRRSTLSSRCPLQHPPIRVMPSWESVSSVNEPFPRRLLHQSEASLPHAQGAGRSSTAFFPPNSTPGRSPALADVGGCSIRDAITRLQHGEGHSHDWIGQGSGAEARCSESFARLSSPEAHGGPSIGSGH